MDELHQWFREDRQAWSEAGEASAEVEAWYQHLHLTPEEAFEAWTAHTRTARDRRLQCQAAR